MTLHRLIYIHSVEARSIEANQPHIADNDQLHWIGFIFKSLSHHHLDGSLVMTAVSSLKQGASSCYQSADLVNGSISITAKSLGFATKGATATKTLSVLSKASVVLY